MKKITLVAAAFLAGFALQAQSLTGTGVAGDVITNGEPGRGGGTVLTLNSSQDIIDGLEIACASGTAFRDNNMFHYFDMSEFGITGDFDVATAEVAIGPVATPDSFPLTINIWANDGDAFPNGDLTLLGTATIDITNGDAQTIVATAVDAVVPAGSDMVMEVVILDDGNEDNFMRFGCNDADSGFSWIQAAACGADVPTLLSDLGLAQVFIMNVVGEEVLSVDDNALSEIAIFPNPATDILNVRTPGSVQINNAVIYDVLGKATNVQVVNGQINVSALSRGVYILNLETSAGTLTEKIVKQ